VDVQREADVIEDILRIYGYNNVEISAQLRTTIVYGDKPDINKLQDEIANMLTYSGFNEIMNNSLSKLEYYLKAGIEEDSLVKILNPLSADLNVYRQTLLFGGLETINRNINRKRGNLHLYEFGNCYTLRASSGENPLDRYDEQNCTALFLHGKKREPNWITPDTESSFYELKAYVEMVFRRLGFNLEDITISEAGMPYLQYGQQYRLKKNTLAQYGSVKKDILKDFDIEEDVFYAEINWNGIQGLLNTEEITFSELPKYPEVKRDLALLLDKDVTFEEIRVIAKKVEANYLLSVTLFDVYEHESLGKDKKSYAVNFLFQDRNKTMTEKQIDKIMDKLMKAYQKELGAQIR
jgi:phenylalanyl-tRNA synthetase beta chain